MKIFKYILPLFLLVAAFLCYAFLPGKAVVTPDADNAGLKLPAGFGALQVAVIATTGSPGNARHLTVTPQGDIYVKMAGGRGGSGVVMLHEDEKGKATVVKTFGNYPGTGIYLKNGYLYTSSNQEVFRYKLDAKNEVIDPTKPETIVTGLKMGRQHETKSIMLDNAGNLYVNVGAPLNSCQEKDRVNGSMGIKGCPILDSAGGIWMFKADKMNQVAYKDGTRYATGLRNVVGLDWNTQNNQLFVMQHGRDQLNMFPQYYTTKQSADLPAETMYALKQGDNAGWPYMYYDQNQRKKILAPEYGGDGKIEGDAKFLNPAAAYPAHMAPDGLLFYTGNQFPDRYKNGAFIAFHGSWNRAPEPQAGYFVVFQPFKEGKPFGDWEVFAEGFSGSAEKTASGRVDHRPCGLAQGPDGSLYVTDDLKGWVYRIVYTKK